MYWYRLTNHKHERIIMHSKMRRTQDINKYQSLSVMKTKQQINDKEFDTVKTFGAIKEKISKDISGMTLAEIQEYLRQQKSN